MVGMESFPSSDGREGQSQSILVNQCNIKKFVLHHYNKLNVASGLCSCAMTHFQRDGLTKMTDNNSQSMLMGIGPSTLQHIMGVTKC